MKIKLEPKILGKSRNFSDDLMPNYNPDIVLFWTHEIINTAKQPYRDNTAAANYFTNPIQLLSKGSINPIMIEIADMEAFGQFKKAITIHIENMPIGIRELIESITIPTAEV